MDSQIFNLMYRLKCIENKILKLETNYKTDILLGSVPSKSISTNIAILKSEKKTLLKIIRTVQKKNKIKSPRD